MEEEEEEEEDGGQEGEDAAAVWVRGGRDFSRDKVLYFEVCGGTVCSRKSPTILRLLLPCLLIMFS